MFQFCLLLNRFKFIFIQIIHISPLNKIFNPRCKLLVLDVFNYIYSLTLHFIFIAHKPLFSNLKMAEIKEKTRGYPYSNFSQRLRAKL